MITKISRQIALDIYPMFPTRDYDVINDEETYFYPKAYSSIILTLNSKSFRGHINLLSTQLNNLVKQLDFDFLTFLGDTKTSWLYQKKNHKPVKEAQQFLVNNKIGQRFNGGLQVDKKDLKDFVKHVSWMTRCNAALPYIYLTDKGQNIIGNICQYGNLHLSVLNDKTDLLLKKILSKSSLIPLKENTCTNQFGRTSKISGRQSLI